MTKVFIVMGHVGDCSETYYVASTLSKAKSWIKKKAKEESKEDPHMKSYYKANPYGYWSVQKWKMDFYKMLPQSLSRIWGGKYQVLPVFWNCLLSNLQNSRGQKGN